ncbi:MAG: hypothetical protein SV765_00340 [Pseudomonadota bacterium]|nr:hypothetical protein [Pseudomonadota bacterium]
MLVLAKWILGGPLQALAAAVALALVPGLGWASAAVVALVALRQNLAQAALPLVGALLVAMLLHWPAGDITQAGSVVAALVGALVLANLRSLSWTLVSLALTAVVYMALVIFGAPGVIEQLVSVLEPQFQDLLAQMKSANPDSPGVLEQLDVRSVVLEGSAWVVTLGAVAALLVARWLQARLYNPGGFRQEFHSLRLMPAIAVALAVLVWLTQSFPALRYAAPCLVMPLFLAGLGLVHGLMGMKPNNGPLLAFFYLGLVLTFWMGMLVLSLVAVVDSFMDFRNRIQKRYE